jgi:hypothetical protein
LRRQAEVQHSAFPARSASAQSGTPVALPAAVISELRALLHASTHAGAEARTREGRAERDASAAGGAPMPTRLPARDRDSMALTDLRAAGVILPERRGREARSRT